MTRPAALHVVVSSDGQPRILIMPRLTWSSTCGKALCGHERCWRARERAHRRCKECGERIEPGSQYTEHRNPVTGDLISQQHILCPPKVGQA